MSLRPRRRKSLPKVPDHPVVPGSTLYRALEQVARAVARQLAGRIDDNTDELPRQNRPR